MKRIHLLLLVLLATLLVGVALAQAAVITDPTTWFVSAAGWGGIVLVITSFLRENVFKGLKGNSVLALVFGLSVGGALLAATGALARFGISLDGALVDTLIFGVTAGGIAAGLWDTGSGLADARGKAMGQAMAFAAVPAGTQQSVTDFIISLVRSAVSAAKLPAALVAVAPLMAQFAQSEAVLTDDLRSKLQGQVLHLLRKAGLTGVDL